jgi:3-hydroxyisobutyrate dehydrogenase-like beta-hydroxyacid dehydrogenase
MKIGVVGLGRMGGAMAQLDLRTLRKALRVTNRL